jgi:hypothetical protein
MQQMQVLAQFHRPQLYNLHVLLHNKISFSCKHCAINFCKANANLSRQHLWNTKRRCSQQMREERKGMLHAACCWDINLMETRLCDMRPESKCSQVLFAFAHPCGVWAMRQQILSFICLRSVQSMHLYIISQHKLLVISTNKTI